MPICGYLITPSPGKKDAVQKSLSSFPEAEVYPAENQNMLIMVTETDSKEQDQELEHQLKSVENIDCLALTFGANPA
jgi:nitrate reductase NapAB chaperone NapD